MAKSFPFSVPTNSSSCSTVSTAVFLRRWEIHFFKCLRRRYNITAKVRACTDGLLPVSNIDRNHVVEVEATPLLHIWRACGTEERPAHLWARTGQKHGGQLLPKSRLPVLKQLIRLVDNQPLHTEHQHNTNVQSLTWSLSLQSQLLYLQDEHTGFLLRNCKCKHLFFWIVRKLRHNQFQRATDSVLPAEVESWGILLEEEDDSVWSADKYIYTQKYQRSTLRGICFHFWSHHIFFTFLPYFLFDFGPYFLAAREALSMMWTLNPTPSDRRSSSL